MSDNKTEDPLVEALKKAQQDAKKKDKETSRDTKDNGQEVLILKEELAKMTETAQRALADLTNFKRRAEEERKRLIEFGNAELINQILPSIDNYERAITHKPKKQPPEEWENWIKGLSQTFIQLEEALKKQGLTEMKALNEKFDPNLHEALIQAPGEKDTVVEVLESGYMLGEKVIRTAKVKVGNGE